MAAMCSFAAIIDWKCAFQKVHILSLVGGTLWQSQKPRQWFPSRQSKIMLLTVGNTDMGDDPLHRGVSTFCRGCATSAGTFRECSRRTGRSWGSCRRTSLASQRNRRRSWWRCTPGSRREACPRLLTSRCCSPFFFSYSCICSSHGWKQLSAALTTDTQRQTWFSRMPPPHLSPSHLACASSRCVSVATATRRRQQQQQQRRKRRMSRIWTWARQRRGTRFTTVGPERTRPKPWPFPATELLPARAHRRSSPDNKRAQEKFCYFSLRNGPSLLLEKVPFIFFYDCLTVCFLLCMCFVFLINLFGCQESLKKKKKTTGLYGEVYVDCKNVFWYAYELNIFALCR